MLIYGSTGYTGDLIARLAVERGLKPILAGRNQQKVQNQAKELGLDYRVFDLSDTAALTAALNEVSVVLHCAGPFSHTWKPMVGACLATQTHYIDITGEIAVFESCAALDQQAREAGIMLLPGAGFDVVPSDCLAAMLKAQMPDASSLTLAFLGIGGGISHGTAKTMAENLAEGTAIRKNGKIISIPSGSIQKKIDFGRGPVNCVSIPWGDVSTAWYSTKIPDIAVFIPSTPAMVFGMKISRYLGWFLNSGPIQKLLKNRIEAAPAGPDKESLENGKSILFGEVQNPKGEKKSLLISGPQGYALTADSALRIAAKILDGNFKVGFATPSLAYGAEFVRELDEITVK